jgi:hypothetical protein
MEPVTHVEGENLSLMGRPLGNTVLLTQTQVSAASIQVFERGSTTAVYTRTLLTGNTPTGGTAECMFLTEQVGAPWPKAGGMTFFYVLQDLPAGTTDATKYHLDGGKVYNIVVTLTAGSAGPTLPELADYGNIKLEYVVTVSSVAGV